MYSLGVKRVITGESILLKYCRKKFLYDFKLSVKERLHSFLKRPDLHWVVTTYFDNVRCQTNDKKHLLTPAADDSRRDRFSTQAANSLMYSHVLIEGPTLESCTLALTRVYEI